MTIYTGKKQRLPAKEGLPGEKILFFVLFLFLVSGLMPSIGLSAFVDREGIKTHLYDITFMEKGHAFTPGSSTRKYTFTSTAIFKYTYKGKGDGADVVDFKHEATWSGNTHQLTVHSTEKHGYYFDLVYRCGKLDPFLAPDPPQCQETSRKSNWSGALTDAWPSYGELPQRLYKAIVMRTSLVYEAIAKSMEPVAPKGEIKSPPGSVLLQVRVADDLMPEPKTPVFFIIERKDGKPAKTLSGEEIHQLTTKFISGITAFKTINGLAPGVYSFHPKSVSSGFDGPKVYFNVVAKAGPGKQPYIVNPTENKEFEAGDKVYINALFTQEKGFASFDYQVKKHGEFKSYGSNKLAIHNSMADIHQQFPENYIYRVRVAVMNQAFDKGNPVWSKWRYFKVGKNFIPGFKRGLSIISPTFGKTYTNSIPIKVVLPKKLDKKTTMTLNWIWGYSAPSAPAGQVPETSVLPTRFYSQKITVKPGVDYAESKMSVSELKQHRDKRYPNLKNKTGAYQLEVVLKTEQGIAKDQTWGPFNIGVPGEAVNDKQEKKSGTFSLDTPIFVKPAEGQIFMAPATVELKILHGKEEGIATRLQYSPFSTDKMAILYYRDSSLKPVATSTKESTTTVTYRIDKPGFWRVQATTTGKLAFDSAWRAFKVDTLKNTTAKSVNLVMPQAITSSKAPRILAPANHAVFQRGQEIMLKIDTHGTIKPLSDEVQFKDKNNKFTLLYTGTAGQSKTGGTVETRLILDDNKLNSLANIEEGATEYRVRVAFAHKDEKGFLQPEEYSPWLYVKILPRLKTPVQTPQKSFIPTKTLSSAQLKKAKPAGKMAQKSINPQPEPPGRQLRNISKNLVILPHPRSFRPGAPIQIAIKNTPFSRVPFELRYRPAPGKSYQAIKHPKHSFNRTNGVTTLSLALKTPGEYQVRVRANHKAPWTGWSSLTVMNNPAGTAALAHQMRMTPAAGSRMINPQPEPPGKVRRHQMQIHGAAGKGQEHPVTREPFSPAATARKMQIAPPKIEQPRNGQKFLLTGKSVQVQARISYAGSQKIQVEVQRETKHRFSAIQPRISFIGNRATTTATIPLQQTGSYRLRVRAGSRGHWSGWTTFTVDTLMKNMPSLQQHTPALKQKTPAKKPALSTKPALQMVR